MTTIKLGFTRGKDDVGKGGLSTTPHCHRLGVTQILTPSWLPR